MRKWHAHGNPPCTGGPLCDLFRDHHSDKHRNHQYCALYERYLPGRDEAFRLLELGVQTGASLRAWEAFFPKAEVLGIDYDPACARVPFQRARLLIGDHSARGWKAEELGDLRLPLAVVIDDGSHIGADIQQSLAVFWPYLAPGGLYVIEDLEASYYQAWYGGGPPGTPGTGLSLVKALIDGVQHLYHEAWPSPYRVAEMHVHANIVFLTKAGP